MAKEEKIELEAEVVEALPDARFKVRLENGQELLAYVSERCESSSFVFFLATRSRLRSARTT